MWKVKRRAVVATTMNAECGGELGQLASVNYDANAEHHLVFLEDLLNRADPEALQNLLETLTDVLDEAKMAEDKGAQVVIRQGFSEQLDIFRHVYDTLNGTFPSSGPTAECISQLPSTCLLYTSPSPRDLSTSRMPSSA